MAKTRTQWEMARRTTGVSRSSKLFVAIAVATLAANAIAATQKNPSVAQHTKQAMAGQKGASVLMDSDYESHYLRLPSDTDVPELKGLIANWNALRQNTTVHSTALGSAGPVRIAICEVGPGTNNHVYVAIHGILSTHKTWRYVVGALPAGSDCWLVDIQGHGDSDKPAPASLGPDGYSPGVVAERILQAVEQKSAARRNPPRITLMGHSLGGMVALRMLSCPELRQRHAALVRQVDDAVLFAPCDVAVGVELGQLVTIAELASYKVGIGNALGLVHDKVAVAEKDGCFSAGYATQESTELLFQAFSTPATLKASQALIKQAVPGWQAKRRPDWSQIRELENNYKNIDVPCLIVWGECDETLPEWIGHKLRDHIPGAQLRELPECKHSPHLECPTRCAELISTFHAQRGLALVANGGPQ